MSEAETLWRDVSRAARLRRGAGALGGGNRDQGLGRGEVVVWRRLRGSLERVRVKAALSGFERP